jgi:hypothetical protein
MHEYGRISTKVGKLSIKVGERRVSREVSHYNYAISYCHATPCYPYRYRGPCTASEH